MRTEDAAALFRTARFRFYVSKGTPPPVAICTNPRMFERLSDAAQEVVDARVWLGIHFRSADDDARRLGERVASWAFYNTLRPVHRGTAARTDQIISTEPSNRGMKA